MGPAPEGPAQEQEHSAVSGGAGPRPAVLSPVPRGSQGHGSWSRRVRALVPLSSRVNTSVQGGQHLDRAGSRVRRWTWPHSVTSPGPQVPLSPTFLSLNRHVGVRILGQDKITVSFLAMGQQAKFNVGTRVQVFLKHTGSSTPWGGREAHIVGMHTLPAVGAPDVTPRCCPPEQPAAGVYLAQCHADGRSSAPAALPLCKGLRSAGSTPGQVPVSPAVPRGSPRLCGGEESCSPRGQGAQQPLPPRAPATGQVCLLGRDQSPIPRCGSADTGHLRPPGWRRGPAASAGPAGRRRAPAAGLQGEDPAALRQAAGVLKLSF